MDLAGQSNRKDTKGVPLSPGPILMLPGKTWEAGDILRSRISLAFEFNLGFFAFGIATPGRLRTPWC
jgi:hypothetical protein